MMKYLSRLLLCFGLFSQIASAERIKDLAHVSGVRSNQLIGYGLVVGLEGTGDSNNFTDQSFKTMLSRLGVQLPANLQANSKNVAAVALSAELPAFAKPGQRIDVTASSLGSAKSLRGGTLMLAYLKGMDGNVYAAAQGNLVVGGFGIEGADGSKLKVNVPVVGRIPNGATVEVAAPSSFGLEPQIDLILHRPDFTTAKKMADVINDFFGAKSAAPLDGSTIQVHAPLGHSERVHFISALENLALTPADLAAKVIVNSRTGTIVIGKHVMVGEAAVSHGSLTVTIAESPQVSQPPGFKGVTTVTPKSEIYASQPNSRMFMFEPGVSLEDIVRAINEVGAAPGDLMAILDALKQAGALKAEMEII